MAPTPSSARRFRGLWAKKAEAPSYPLARPRKPVIVQWRDAFADRSDEAHIAEEPIIKWSMGWLRSLSEHSLVLIHEYDDGQADIFYTTIPAPLVVSVTYLHEEES